MPVERTISSSQHKVDTGEVDLIADLDDITPNEGAMIFVREDSNIYRGDGSAWAILG